ATLGVTLLDDGRELARTTVVSPGAGAEAVAELRGTPVRPGLAVWTARLDSVAGEITTRNNTRALAFPVAPGRLRVELVTAGLNWDFAFLRRSIEADSSLEVRLWVRQPNGWRGPAGARASAPGDADLAGAAPAIACS